MMASLATQNCPGLVFRTCVRYLIWSSCSLILVLVRFNDAFYVEQVYRLTDRQAKARIRQCGLLTTPTGRFSFTSWLPFYLDQGRTYSLTGVLYDRPYQNRHQVTLDRATHVERHAIQPQSSQPKGVRQLCPRPPPSFQPRLLVQNNPLAKTSDPVIA